MAFKLGVLVCLLQIFSNMVAAQEPLTAILKSVNDATLDMYLAVADLSGEDTNVLVSPLSAALCTAMVHAGARGETANEITRGLHFPSDSALLEKGFAALHDTLANTKNVTLEVANRIYVEKTSKLNEDYKGVVTRVHRSEIQQADFKNRFDEERVNINDWVSQKTHDKIKDLLRPGMINPESRLVLVNAIYFHGKWTEPFDRKQTYAEDFYVSEGQTVKVPMMHLTKHLKYAEIPELDAKAVELSYANDGVCLQIILPNKRNGLSALQQKLRSKVFDLSNTQFHSTEVHLSMPKFKIEETIDLKAVFMKMGINTMFSYDADFSGIIEGEPLKVTDAVQKTFMDVNEEGTEAAAATAIVGGLESESFTDLPDVFYVDHPFLLRLVANRATMFMGHVGTVG